MQYVAQAPIKNLLSSRRQKAFESAKSLLQSANVGKEWAQFPHHFHFARQLRNCKELNEMIQQNDIYKKMLKNLYNRFTKNMIFKEAEKMRIIKIPKTAKFSLECE